MELSRLDSASSSSALANLASFGSTTRRVAEGPVGSLPSGPGSSVSRWFQRKGE
jgi:hypothetical protein